MRIWLLFLLVVLAPAEIEGAGAWNPIQPEELKLAGSVVEKNADAEAIFWEVKLANELASGQYPRKAVRNYIRIKIFTERGREAQSNVEIPYFGKSQIADVYGRTILPDGKIIELKNDAIFDKVVAKGAGYKERVKSFAMPGVVPGALIEYQWKEIREDLIERYTRLPFQRDIPIQLVKYAVKPLGSNYTDESMHDLVFHCQPAPFQVNREGFYETSLKNVPAFHAEPHMPPKDAVQPWVLLYYTTKSDKTDKYWSQLGRDIAQQFKTEAKVNEEIRAAAKEAKGNAKNEDETIANLIAYCRSKVKNVAGEATNARERGAFKPNKSSIDTLKQGLGTGHDINILFASLALAAALEAHDAYLPDRGDLFFNRNLPDRYFLPAEDIAIKTKTGWRFYDAAARYYAPGSLRWQEEGVDALIGDAKDPEFVRTQIAKPEQTFEKSTADLTLKEDGAVEGEVTIEYGGHLAAPRKAANEYAPAAEREQMLKDEVKERWGTAEVSNIRVEGAENALAPFVYKFHIRVEGFAQRTGKRLLLTTSFFRANETAMFTAAERTHPVYFHYPWMEQDTVLFHLPEGYELDHPDASGGFRFPPSGECINTIKYSVEKKLLVYNRRFVFGSDGQILFDPKLYPQLRKIFERLHEDDTQALSFKAAGAAK